MSDEKLINVMIIDDHKVLLEGLQHLINHSGIAHVTDIGYSVADCRALLEHKLPDVLILDVGLPDGDGCNFCTELCKQYPSLKILMLTSYAEMAVITRALDGGALGYVLKNATSEEILDGIHFVALGRRFLCSTVENLFKKNTHKRIVLTGRERELLKLIVDGLPNAEIADKMCLAEQTVKGYRKNLVLKLQVQNTAQLVRMAIEEKLV
ncbi:MAG: response regulator transcription factor [Bacteroidales bacterium]|nr:response regulator transcription factor [Bacteroidales bacterium]